MGTLKLNKKTNIKENFSQRAAKGKVNQELKTADCAATESATFAARLAQADGGFVGELKDKRTANSAVYRRNDRTLRRVISAVPQYYPENGEMKEINNKLTDDGNEIVNEANSFRVRFSKNSADGKIFSLHKGGNTVVMRAADTASGQHAAACMCALCEDGDNCVQATLADGTGIRYSVLNDRVKEDIIITERRDSYEYLFTLSGEGLTAVEGGHNDLLLKDGDGATQFIIPAPFMYDAAGVRSEDVCYEVEQSDGVLAIKVVAGKEFINDASRTFPVTIDPQIVVSGTDVLQCTTECYQSGQAENDISYNTLWLERNNNGTYDSYAWITVNKNNISGINGAVEKVVLQLTSKTGASGYFKCDDVIYGAYKSTYSFDITKKYVNAKNSFTVNLSAHVDNANSSFIEFETTGTSAPKLIITYLEDEEEIIAPTIKSIDLIDNVNSYVDLKTGATVNSFNDFTSSDFSIPVSLCHFHRAGGSSAAYGSNWSLSIDKQLKTATNDSDGTTRLLYTDELGNKYTFTESYYYLSGGERIYVAKNAVAIDIDGNMSYDGNRVYKQQKCLGNSFVAKPEDFAGIQYIEQRIDEQIELEEFVRSYSASLITYVAASRNTGEIVQSLNSLTKENCEALLRATENNSLCILLTKSEALQLQSVCENLEYLQLQSEQTYLQAAEDEDLSKDTTLSAEERENARERMEMELKIGASLAGQRNVLLGQKSNLIVVAQQNFENIKATFETFFKRKDELDVLLRHTPVNYLKDADGIYSGFNESGKLVCMLDLSGKYVTINYNGDNMPQNMCDNKGYTVNFNYENGKLASLTDSIGRTVKYTYSGENLSTVAFADGVKLTITYSSNLPATITSSQDVKATLAYSSNKLTGVSVSSKPVSVGKKVTASSSAYSESIKNCTFVYGSGETTVDDGEDNTESYTFNAEGKLVTYKEQDSGDHHTVTNYTYATTDSGRQVTSVQTKNYRDAVTTIKKFNLSDLLISETEDWFEISDSSRVKTVTEYSYDNEDKLLEQVETKYIETDGVSRQTVSHVKYGYNANGSLVLTESYVEGEELTSGRAFEERVYDENGNLVKTITWNSLDSSSKFYSESEYSESGLVTAEKGETGETSAEYEYVSGTNIVNSMKYPGGGKFAYGRNPYNGEITSVTQSTEDGEANTTDIIYNYGLPVEVKSGNTVIGYIYDYKGRKTKVEIDGVTQATYSYSGYEPGDESCFYGKTVETLADGTVWTVSKSGDLDEDEGSFKTWETYYADGTQLLRKIYNVHGQIYDVRDIVSGDTVYTYDDYHNLTQVKRTQNNTVKLTENYSYNARAELTQKAITGEVEQTYTYMYKDNAARDLDYVGYSTYKFYPLTDVNGRNTGREIYSGTAKVAGEYITYRKVGDHATNMPATVWFGRANAVRDSVKYKYDARGNIIEITQNGHLYARYKYDSLNRLIREDNKALDKTTVYAYDSNGNITERCDYAYTSRDGEELTELECTHYSYDYAGDRLVSYNGAAINYNTLGNPASYCGKALTWEYGKRLTKYGNTTFAYNGAGRRISKNNISYIYDSDGRLLKQSNGLEFIYDNSCVIGVKYGGNTYFYRRDAQGNIAAILDNNGNIIVQYLYDAWGNHAVLDSNGNDIESGIGILNPFRYRGYYYDTETELYYLQTRYYDPEVGRFISRDSIEYADPEAINGLNLYAYCGNNPVMNVDFYGTSVSSFFKSIGNWFKKAGKAIKDFFVNDVYGGVIKPAWDWVSNVAAPAVKDFFTITVPNFFVDTVWNGGIVPAWNSVSNFFTTTVPNFFVNTFWNNWIVDKVWNNFIVGTIYKKGLVPAWNWVNGDKWYQILVKNVIVTLIGAALGAIAGPHGAVSGAIIGLISGVFVGAAWDYINLGWNN